MTGKKAKERIGIFNIGTALLLVVLTGLCLFVLAALALSSAKNDLQLSEELAAHTKTYYALSAAAEEQLLDISALYEERDAAGQTTFTESADTGQELRVTVRFGESAEDYTITQWQIVNTDDWEAEETLPLLQ